MPLPSPSALALPCLPPRRRRGARAARPTWTRASAFWRKGRGPALRELQGALQNLDAYHPPEVLPNGDILIRRKEPLPGAPAAPGTPDEGEVDL